MTMELEDQNSDFNETQFIADYLNANFQNKETFNNFIQTITNNVGYFASITRTDSENFFSQFSNEVVTSVHASLAETVLVHHDLKSQFKAKDNPKHENFFNYFWLIKAQSNHTTFQKSFQKTVLSSKRILTTS